MTANNLIKVRDDDKYIYLAGMFKGNVITFLQDKITMQVMIKLDEAYAKAIGFRSLEEMMSNNQVLDKMNEIKAKTGQFPLKQIKY